MLNNYVYKEPEERVERRNEIRKSQIPIEVLQKLVDKGANEREIQMVLKKDLSFLADVFARPEDEYICLAEFPIGGHKADFVVLTSRSRMEICLIEIKGADFYAARSSYYQGMNRNIYDAAGQINKHIRYIEGHYEAFRQYVHGIREQVIKGNYKSNYLLGPQGELYVDPLKDIKFRKVVIGGKVKDDYVDSRRRTEFEKDYMNDIEAYSWDSFITRLDMKHGHYFDDI